MPDGPAYQAVADAVAEGLPIAIPSPVLSEVSFGVARKMGSDPTLVTQREWLLELLEIGVLRPLAVTVAAADVAGELRARQPTPPTGMRKRKGEKPEQRVGWMLDLLIAATAWVHGCDIVTRNSTDFERIAELLPASDVDTRLRVGAPPSGI